MEGKLEHILVRKQLVVAEAGTDLAPNFTPSSDHLALINKYTLEPVQVEQVRAFPMLAMNDSIDRDYEQFTTDCIMKLANNKGEAGPLGKSFILSHVSRELGNGRIYFAEPFTTGNVTHLKIWVYVPNTPQYKDFIENLVYGVYWAVSVGVSVKKASCSVCGTAWPKNYMYECENNHQRGMKYEGSLCFRAIEQVGELYELSSVYLGAQYGAEVVKKMVTESGRSLAVIREAILEVNTKEGTGKVVSGGTESDLPPEEMELTDDDATTKPYPEEHACRLNDPGKYERFRRQNGARTHKGKKYDVIWGIKSDGTVEQQAFRYKKDVWTAAQAKAHCAANKGSFEAAQGSTASAQPIEADWLDVSRACLQAMLHETYDDQLAERCKELGRTVPWDEKKLVALMDEGAIFEVLGIGTWVIEKGKKVWEYDGHRVIRKEVRRMNEEMERLTRDLDTRTEELEAMETDRDRLETTVDEATEEKKVLTKELEEVKSELASKVLVVEHYLKSIRDSIVKWYKLSKDPSEGVEVDTTVLMRLLDKCGDDPELLLQLEEDFEEQAGKNFPELVRRSSVEDGEEFEETKVPTDVEGDDEGAANELHS